MTLAFPSPEYDDAVAAACHGTATDAEMEALNALLRHNPAARDDYLFRVELHSRLASEPDLFCESGDSVVEVPAPYAGLGERRPVLHPPPGRPVGGRKWARTLALAAGLTLVAIGVWHAGFKRPATRHGATSTAVAMLTRVVDARWASTTGLLRVGSALEPGWLHLESGLAQVVFYSGARVVIEGPAALRLDSPSDAMCPKGRLLAEVPPPARGFRLQTDHLDIRDLGTAFGVDATPGRTEVHVFKGEVELAPGKAAAEPLSEGQAVVVAGGGPPRRMAASTAAFLPLFEFQMRSLASEAIGYDQWRLRSARLNQDPSLAVHLDFEDLNDSDWKLRNTATRRRPAPDAIIVGCQRAEGRWREKPALEFQSVNDRVRLAVPGEFDALTLSAWVCVKGLDRQFNSLFMCDGFEAGTVHWLIRNDGVIGLTVIGPGARDYQILATPPVVTLDRFGMWLHLAVVLDGRAGQVVHYVNGSAVARQAFKPGPPLQLGSAELGNWNAQHEPHPAPFLIRNFSGSFDEFELFSRALSDDEIRDLHAHGKPGV